MRRFPWWLLLGCVVIPCLYLQMLRGPFDFIDDSCLVYSKGATSPWGVLAGVWDISTREVWATGPFRPVAWAHWDVAAFVFGPDAFVRRIDRLLWCSLSVGTFLWFLREMGVSRAAALITATLAFGNWYRGELWIYLGQPEAFGLPYAMTALCCAARAARSRRPLKWDLAGACALALCLGVKNVYVALIPPLVWLRLTPGSRPWREQLSGAAFYAGLVLWPATHFLLLKLYPQPYHYATRLPGWNVVAFVKAVTSAANLMTLLPTLFLAGLALRGREVIPPRLSTLGTALGLFVCGVAVYSPIPAATGRYTMPAVWGMDVALGLLLTTLIDAPATWVKRLALCAVGITVVIVAARCVTVQDEQVAMSRMLWQAAERLEALDSSADVAIVGKLSPTAPHDVLTKGIGFHLQTHLQIRTRMRAGFDSRDPGAVESHHTHVLTGGPAPGPAFVAAEVFESRPWAGGRVFRVTLYERKTSE